MTITIEAGILARAMKSAAGIVASTQTIPILANAKLDADGDELEITTSDLDTEYRQRVPLAKGGTIRTTVDAKRLNAIAGVAEPGAQIRIGVDGSRMTVQSGRSRWTLSVLPADDFPVMPAVDFPPSLAIPGKALAAALSRTLWSVSSEDTRYYLCGIFLDPEDGRLRFTSTNGHTLACALTAVAWPGEGEDLAPTAIVPTRFAQKLKEHAAEAENVRLSWDASKIRAKMGGVILTGKLIDGTFPEYRRVIPDAVEKPAIFEPEPMRKALRRLQVISNEKTRAVAVDIRDNCFAMQMLDSNDGSQATEELPASTSAMHRTGFNVAYLAQAIEMIGGDTVEFHQADISAMAMLRRTVDDGALAIVMPFRI